MTSQSICPSSLLSKDGWFTIISTWYHIRLWSNQYYEVCCLFDWRYKFSCL